MNDDIATNYLSLYNLVLLLLKSHIVNSDLQFLNEKNRRRSSFIKNQLPLMVNDRHLRLTFIITVERATSPSLLRASHE